MSLFTATSFWNIQPIASITPGGAPILEYLLIAAGGGGGGSIVGDGAGGGGGSSRGPR
jgi:hypothetical protein